MTDLKPTLLSALGTLLAALAPVFAPWVLLWLQLRLSTLTLGLRAGVMRVRGHTRSGGSAFPPIPPGRPLGGPEGAPSALSGPDPPLSP